MMRILIDICHPGDVHFFYHPIRLLNQAGHQILVTSRDKDVACRLLDHFEIEHIILSTQGAGGILALAKELLSRNWQLYRQVRRFKPDVMTAFGGTFVAQVGYLTRVPRIIFYDTETAVLQNLFTYPFASKVIVPACYQGWLPARRQLRYQGCSELSYLHPNYFSPDRECALKNGLARQGDTFLLRLVAWKANHDLWKNGWDDILLSNVLAELGKHGKVLICTERPLSPKFASYLYPGAPEAIHHVMAFCRACIGESATMASESAVLGVPAIYAADFNLGYIRQHEKVYGLVRYVPSLQTDCIQSAIRWALGFNRHDANIARQKFLADSVDLSRFIVDNIENFRDNIH